jgi:hypothetical protein
MTVAPELQRSTSFRVVMPENAYCGIFSPPVMVIFEIA